MSDTKKQKYYIYTNSIFHTQALIGYVLVIFYTTKLNISLAQYIYLDTILFLLLSFFEIPSGYISDLFGRKFILILGQLILLLSMFVLLVADSYDLGLINIILIAIGSSLISGNSGSILYDYFTKKDNLDNYKTFIANSSSIAATVAIFFSLLSGILLKFNMKYILYFDIVIYIINILCTYYFLVDVDEKHNKQSENKEKLKIRHIPYNTIIAFISASLIFVFFRVTYNYYQPYYTAMNVPLEYFGLFPIYFNIIAVLSAQIFKKYIAHKISYNYNQIILMYSVIFISSLILVFSKKSLIIFMIIILIQQFIREMDANIHSIFINKQIPKNTKYRTTYISIKNAINTILISIFLFISSALIKNTTLYQAFFLIALLTIGTGTILICLKNILNKKVSTE